MFKFVALYKTPADHEAFMAHYRDVHMPLVKKLPGLISAEITKLGPAMMGEKGNFLLAEMRFADETAFKTAMKSPENAAAGKDLDAFAAEIVTVMKGEVVAI